MPLDQVEFIGQRARAGIKDRDAGAATRAEIQPGKVLYEIVGVPEELAREAFALAAAKLPMRTTFVTRMLGQ